MAILRAAATADDTLDATSDTLINSMTLTPAADDYLLFFNAEVIDAATAGSEITTFSVYVGGTKIDHSERERKEDTSVDGVEYPISLSCKVSPNGSQAVEIRYRGASASPPICRNRELVLFPIPAAGTDYQLTDLGDDTIASSTFALLPGMTVTPVADDYLLVFTTSCDATSGGEPTFRVTVGGTVVAHTVRSTFQESSSFEDERSMLIACKVSPNGSQLVEIEWAEARNTDTATCHERTMNLIPMDAGDIFEASGTVDDVDSTTTDKQIDDLIISAPGADDYLVIFSSTNGFGVLTANQSTTFSIREGGVQVTDSARIQSHDASLDNTNLEVAAGGRVTVTGTDDLQMYWQGSATDTRTLLERTFVAVREAAPGGAIAATPALTFSAAADLKGEGKLDATAALAFTQAADLRAEGKLNATAALLFGGTADLNAPGALGGSPALAFSQAAALKAPGKLDAAASLLFAAATALLRGTGLLAATASLAFSATADLKGAPSPISATSALVISATANLKADGKLDATPALVFGGSANLDARGKLDATSALIFSAAADLNALGSLNATALLVFSAAANLDASGKLDATTAQLIFSATADLKDAIEGQISATPALAFAGTADLNALGTLNASPALAVMLGANLTGRGQLTAAPALAFTQTANLDAKGRLNATALLVFTQAAALVDTPAGAPFHHIDITAATRGISITGFAGRIN